MPCQPLATGIRQLLIAAAFASALFASAAGADTGPERKVLLLPPRFEMSQLTASGALEPMPEWTASARDGINNAAVAALEARPEFTLLPQPPFTPEEQAAIDEHLALIERVLANRLLISAAPGTVWAPRLADFGDRTGDGLAFLNQKYGADIAAFAVGEQAKSTGGRQAMNALTMIAGAAVGVAIIPGSAQSRLVIGTLDASTGNVRWANMRVNISANMGSADDAAKEVTALVDQYPDGTLVRRPKMKGAKVATPAAAR